MKHYIVVKFKKDYNWKENVKDIKNLFNDALTIKDVYSINLMESNSDKNNRYDIMIEMELSQNALQEFDNSYIHKNWKLLYGEHIEQKAIFDCEK